jgi:hypothetical protein
MTDPDQLAALAKALPPDVIRDAYRDLGSPLLRQFARFGENFLKTIRLALFPIQLFAAVQDRVEARLNKAISLIAELYVNLLSRAMDGERVGEAHPAFVGLISQLAPDEVLFLRVIVKYEYTIIVKLNDDWNTPSSKEIDAVFEFMKNPNTAAPDPRISRARSMVFNYATLNQPELFHVFLEHLVHMGVVEYTNDPGNRGDYPRLGFRLPPSQEDVWKRPSVHAIRLSHFGKLFYKACVPST